MRTIRQPVFLSFMFDLNFAFSTEEFLLLKIIHWNFRQHINQINMSNELNLLIYQFFSLARWLRNLERTFDALKYIQYYNASLEKWQRKDSKKNMKLSFLSIDE